MVLITEAGGPQVVDLDSGDGFECEVVFRESRWRGILQDVRLFVDVTLVQASVSQNCRDGLWRLAIILSPIVR
jgi:hypothetical protein